MKKNKLFYLLENQNLSLTYIFDDLDNMLKEIYEQVNEDEDVSLLDFVVRKKYIVIEEE